MEERHFLLNFPSCSRLTGTPGRSLHRSRGAHYFIRTLRAPRAICFQVSLNGIREKYPQGIIFKGDFKRSPRRKKKKTIARLNSRGVAGEILLSKTVKMEPSFQFQGKMSVGHNEG